MHGALEDGTAWQHVVSIPKRDRNAALVHSFVALSAAHTEAKILAWNEGTHDFSDGEALNFDPARAVPDSRLLVLKIRQRRIDQVRDLLRQNPPNKAAARLEIERAKTYRTENPWRCCAQYETAIRGEAAARPSH